MIPKYINDWLEVIENMKNDNTYKLAWGRALIECIYLNKYKLNGKKVVIELNDIAKCIIKYYCNKDFFFNLKQSPYSIEEPTIVQIVKKLIKKYKELSQSNIPVWFDKAEKRLESDLNKSIKRVVSILPENVSWRFKNINNKILDLYEYDYINRSKIVIFNSSNVKMIKEYSFILSKLLSYKWAQLLEKYNYAPKIINKVNSISDSKLKRASLVKYKEELLKQFEKGKPVDFYSGKQLDLNDISVDHVIPWSFMYSDDIWNLVLTSKSYNSLKSNSTVSEEIIKKLKERNKMLVEHLSKKYKDELQQAIDNDLVDKFFFEFKM